MNRRATSAAAVLLALAGPFAGCADPTGAFDDFEKRYTADNPGAGGSGGSTSSGGPDGGKCKAPAVAEADGTYYFTLEPNLLKAAKEPIVFTAQLKTTESGGQLQVTLTTQALTSADRTTPAAGAPVVLGPFAVAGDGSFTWQFPQTTVPSDGNPLGNGAIVSTIALSGAMCAPVESFCGTVTGSASQPLPIPDLKGSTFTFQKVTGPSDYPKPPKIDCAGTLAKAI